MLSILLTVLLLHLGALALKKRTALPSAAAYLSVVLALLLALLAGGMLDRLRLSGILGFGVILAVTVFDVTQEKRAWLKRLHGYATLPIVLSTASITVFSVGYAVAKPLFSYWDEFSFWGVSAKVVQVSNRLYTVADRAVTLRTIPCGNALLNYLFQFWNGGFCEYALYLAYAAFFFAVFAAAAELIQAHLKSTSAGTLAYLALLLTPYLYAGHKARASFTAQAYGYGTAMVDMTLPVAALAIVVLYHAAPTKKWYLAALAFAPMIKDTGVVFALAAGGLVLLYQLLFAPQPLPAVGRRRAAAARIGWAAVDLALPLAVYILWQAYAAATAPVAAAATAAASPAAADGVLSRALVLIQQIVIPSCRSAAYQAVLDDMWQQFLSIRTLYPFSDVTLVCVLFAVTAAGMCAAPGRKKIQLALVQLLLAAGAVLYCMSISYYISFFGDGMVEYLRYMSSYYYLWVEVMLVLILTSVQPRWLPAARVALAAVAVMFAGCLLHTVGVEHTAFTSADNVYQSSMQVKSRMEQWADVLQPDDRVYLVYPDRDTIGYFYAIMYLYPAQVDISRLDPEHDFSINYRTERAMETAQYDYYTVATPQEFAQEICRNFDYVYIHEPDEDYWTDYNGLFEGGMAIGQLYRTDAAAEVPFTAVEATR